MVWPCEQNGKIKETETISACKTRGEKIERERQRFTYIDAIEQHGRKKGKTLREMESLTKDRKAWRAFVRTHPTPQMVPMGKQKKKKTL